MALQTEWFELDNVINLPVSIFCSHFFSRSLSVFVRSDWIRHFKFPMRQLSKHKIVNSAQKIYVSHNKKIMLFDFFSELWGNWKHYLIFFWFSVWLLRNVIVLCSYHICENKLFFSCFFHISTFFINFEMELSGTHCLRQCTIAVKYQLDRDS